MILTNRKEAATWFKHNISNFTPQEFYCNCGCNELLLDTDLIKYLQYLRTELDIPLKINSGYRCIAHNTAISGSVDSQHTKGKAVDISCVNSTFWYKILTSSSIKNFKGIGLHKQFIHLDTRDSVSVVFFY